MKRFLSVFLSFVLAFVSVPFVSAANAEDGVSGDFTYTADGGKVTITGYNGSVGEVVIPAEIEGLPVTAIGAAAFSMENIFKVTMPDSITNIGDSAFSYAGLTEIMLSENLITIGEYAFSSCNIIEVTIPDKVTDVGYAAFYNCKNLRKVILGSSMKSLKRGLFSYCVSLTDITLPIGVTNIEIFAFDRCTSLTEINVDTANTKYSSSGGVLFDKNMTKLILHPTANARTAYVIPDSVTGIENDAFNGCKKLTQITVPDTVTSIGANAFTYCESLTDITIPYRVTNIGNEAFFGCMALTGINVDSGNTAYSSIDGVLFNKNITKLVRYPIGNARTEYMIPESVTVIGYEAFYDCINLTEIKISGGVTVLENFAFSYCGITEIKLPDGVTSIGDSTFSGCEGLSEVLIPNSVRTIGKRAFMACSLQAVTIPKSVTSIGQLAFMLNDNLTIYGYSGSAAETYADENNVPFISLDGNGIIISVKEYLLGIKTLTQGETAVFDINGDEKVDFADLALMKRMVGNNL
ncbi:MAG: leucine-rich repeat protein [Oscillospiraceae bacterium]|jgi:hypothetical protein|nr:leucine-rich repeat protein [Oscillospiraceae bacterium]